MGRLSYTSGEQSIDDNEGEITRQLRVDLPGDRLITWLRRALGNRRASGFLLMTLDGKLSREQRLLKER